MENPFKEIQRHTELSKKIKESILSDIVMITKTLEFHDAILENYPNTLSNCLKK